MTYELTHENAERYTTLIKDETIQVTCLPCKHIPLDKAGKEQWLACFDTMVNGTKVRYWHTVPFLTYARDDADEIFRAITDDDHVLIPEHWSDEKLANDIPSFARFSL